MTVKFLRGMKEKGVVPFSYIGQFHRRNVIFEIRHVACRCIGHFFGQCFVWHDGCCIDTSGQLNAAMESN